MPSFVLFLLLVGTAIVFGILGGIAVFFVARAGFLRWQHTELLDAEARAQQRLPGIETEAKERLLEAKEEAVRIRRSAEEEARETRAQAQQSQLRLQQKEENLERRIEDFGRREQAIAERERGVEELRAELEDATQQQLRELDRAPTIPRQEAQRILTAQPH